MCSIYGALVGTATPSNLHRIGQTFARSSQRGRDSWGMCWVAGGGTSVVGQSTTGEGEFDVTCLHGKPGPFTLVGNRRAEPTTEWVKDKTDADVQPFQSAAGWVYAHNGTISNDQALLDSLRPHARFVEPVTSIDSAVVGIALDCLGWEDGIRALEGSFAIVAAHASQPERLYFAANYKPLFVQSDRHGSLLQIASQASFFPATANGLRDPQPVEIEPYSIGHVGADGRLHRRTLYAAQPSPRRVLAVCSGGLDSTVAAYHHHAAGDEVTLLHVDYGCRAAAREHQALARIAERMGRPAVVLKTDFFGAAAQSPLTQRDGEIRDGGTAAELGNEWVPARNLVLFSLAFAYAEAHGFDVMAVGTNLEESSGGYPDNEQEFVNKLAGLAPYALRPYHRLELSQPCGTLMKRDIVALGHRIGAPIDLTWSCYRDGAVHCGTCGPCHMRKVAHAMNGLADPAFDSTEDLAHV